MIVDQLPVERKWKLSDGDDLVITFCMKDADTLIPLTGCTAFSQIRTTDNADTGTLIATGACDIANDVITVVYAKEVLTGLVDETVYGDIRITTPALTVITLLSFSANVKPTVSREVIIP